MIPKIPTGIPGMDMLTHGGLPANSTVLISGVPGSGKTTLAMQFLFHNATPEAPALFISTVSEPQSRLLQYMQQYTFFDLDKVGSAIHFEDLGGHLLEKNGDTAIRRTEELILEYRPRYLVIDSFRSLIDLSDDTPTLRRAIFRLAALLASLTCTTLLVGEYQRQDLANTIEATIVDGIVILENQSVSLRDLRNIRIIKLRGSDYEAGEHACKITTQGLVIFPRFRTPSSAVTYTTSRERVPIGIPGFDDELLPGGLLRGTNTLLSGDPGIGKTVTALHFLLHGASIGETGLYISFQEDPNQLRQIARNFRLGIDAEEKRGRFRVVYTSPVELDLDEHAYLMLDAIKSSAAQRVVIDSISDLMAAANRGTNRFFDFIYAFSQWCKDRHITTLFTTEMGSIFSSDLVITGRGVSHIADNILLMRYAELNGEIHRALTLLSARGSDHSKKVYEYLIDEAEGPRLSTPLRSAFSLFHQTERL
ncbi:MAG: circadian clock protein KaiC [Anaerolineales bacterium]